MDREKTKVKQCAACKLKLAITEFYPSRKSASFDRYCKTCRSMFSKIKYRSAKKRKLIPKSDE